jgi:hypothetical protein
MHKFPLHEPTGIAPNAASQPKNMHAEATQAAWAKLWESSQSCMFPDAAKK